MNTLRDFTVANPLRYFKNRQHNQHPGVSRWIWLGAVLVAAELLMAPAFAKTTGKFESSTAETVVLEQVGQARLKFLFWSVYDSRLYTASGEYSEGERPLRLEIEYLLDVKAEALLERTLSEWESMGRSHPHQQQWRQELSGIWTDIKSGDVLSLELDSEHRSTFRRNGEVLGRIEDPEFGQEFVDIWLSEDCTRPEIRLALLGKKSA